MTDLERSTQMYWRLSSIKSGRLREPMNVGEALDAITQLERTLGPHRRLATHVSTLGYSIVMGDGEAEDLTKTPTGVITKMIAYLSNTGIE